MTMKTKKRSRAYGRGSASGSSADAGAAGVAAEPVASAAGALAGGVGDGASGAGSAAGTTLIGGRLAWCLGAPCSGRYSGPVCPQADNRRAAQSRAIVFGMGGGSDRPQV